MFHICLHTNLLYGSKYKCVLIVYILKYKKNKLYTDDSMKKLNINLTLAA